MEPALLDILLLQISFYIFKENFLDLTQINKKQKYKYKRQSIKECVYHLVFICTNFKWAENRFTK